MAVYTEVTDDDLSAFLARYDVGSLVAYKGIAEGVENTNYLVQTTKARFILTLYEKRVAPEDLPFFLGLMEHVAEQGVSCPRPVHARDGTVLSELAGRTAAMVTFLDGFSVKKPRADHCNKLGRALAQFHLAATTFSLQRDNALGEIGWRPLFEKFRPRSDEIVPGLQALIHDELSLLDASWPRSLPRGVIHADLFPDNVFFLGDQLSGLIDFYFACNDMLAYDVAICLNAWCFENDHSYNVTKGRALLQAYAKIRPLTDAELAALPLLARGAALRFLATRVVDWLNVPPGALVRPKSPQEYFRKLRFHQKATSVHDYGVEARELA
jgi:homoserine kinase type II